MLTGGHQFLLLWTSIFTIFRERERESICPFSMPNEDTIIKCEINCESLSHFLQGKGGGRPFLNIVNIHVHQCQNWRTLVTWPLKKWSREKPERNQSLPTNFIHVVRVLVCENTDWKHATQWSGDSRYLDMTGLLHEGIFHVGGLIKPVIFDSLPWAYMMCKCAQILIGDRHWPTEFGIDHLWS